MNSKKPLFAHNDSDFSASSRQTEMQSKSGFENPHSHNGVNSRVSLPKSAIAFAIATNILLLLTVGMLGYHLVNQSTTATERQLLFLLLLVLIIELLLSGIGAMIANRMASQLQDHLYKQTTEAEQLKLFTNILLLIRSSLNSEDLFNITVTQARLALLADRVVIYRLNGSMGREIIAESVSAGLPVALDKTIEDAYISPEMIETYRKGSVLAINNVKEAGFAPEYLRLMEQLQIKAKLVTPILKDNQVFGFLIAHHCQSPHIWQLYEINFLQQLATQVGLTLERVSLQQATQALSDFTTKLSGTLNAQDVYNLLVHKLRQALKADRAVMYKFDHNWFGSVIAESVITGWQSMIGAEFHDPCLQNYIEKYRLGRVQAINNIYQAGLTHCYIQQLEPFAVKANLVTPILVGEQLNGLLIVHQCSQPRVWQQSEIYLCEQFAKIVGLAIERVNFLEQTEKKRLASEIFSPEQSQQQERLQLQLLQMLQELEAAKTGDLTVRASVTSGEIGTVAVFFNSILSSLRSLFTRVKLTALEVDSAMAQNSEAFAQQTIKALKQTDQINHSLDSIDKIRLSVQEVAQTARQATVFLRTASRTAKTADLLVDFTVENLLSLQQTMEKTNQKVQRLQESSLIISRVVALIQQIAMQANLLAINVGTEAARANSQEFTTIAEQMTLLAAKCNAATSEMKEISSIIRLEASEAAKAIELETAKVVEGTRLVQHSKQSLSQIFSVFLQIDELVQSIAATTMSSVQNSQEVTNLLREIAQVSEETSSASWQVSTSIQTIRDISQKLQASISTIKVDEEEFS